GNDCGSPNTCESGVCVDQCGDLTYCEEADACVDLENDPTNCGECGMECLDGGLNLVQCEQGICRTCAATSPGSQECCVLGAGCLCVDPDWICDELCYCAPPP
ncbi:MAG: hypothetical protein ACPHRO_09335, partial [Nannocystaceae bacterium]